MRMIALTLEDIRFERKVYDLDLKESIARRGLAFPLRQAEREKVNGLYRELYTYLSEEENAGNFYFIDVYSSVSDGGIPYSER